MNRYNGMTWQQRQAAKKVSEQERIASAAKRTPSEQLNRLDKKLGTGIGAKKERARLNKLIQGNPLQNGAS